MQHIAKKTVCALLLTTTVVAMEVEEAPVATYTFQDMIAEVNNLSTRAKELYKEDVSLLDMIELASSLEDDRLKVVRFLNNGIISQKFPYEFKKRTATVFSKIYKDIIKRYSDSLEELLEESSVIANESDRRMVLEELNSMVFLYNKLVDLDLPDFTGHHRQECFAKLQSIYQTIQ